MNKATIRFVVATLAILLAFAAGRYWRMDGDESAGATKSDEPEILYWVAPMDPDFRRSEPGKSPMGMDLVPVYADGQGDNSAGIVSIDPAIVNSLGVRTEGAVRGPLPRRIETVGYVSYDEGTLQHVHTRVDGWIEKLAVSATGDPVTKGQLLFELYSPTLVNAQEEFLAALGSASANLADASRQRLSALGVSPLEIDRLARDRKVRQRIQVFAESDGFVSHLGVRDGIYVTPSTDILSIAKLDDIWVLAEVFERQSGWVEAGQSASVALDFAPAERREGLVDYVYPTLDPKTRTLAVRLRFDNEDGVLKPNMFTRVTIFGSRTEDVVHVPREALIRGGRVNRVVIAEGEGRFRAQPVEIGIESGDRVEIRRGVSAGDRLVTSGQFLIDSESSIDSALARFEAGQDEAAMPEDGSADGESQQHSDMDHSEMDHSTMDHSQMDHSNMDHSQMDHSGMDHSKAKQPEDDHSHMDHDQ